MKEAVKWIIMIEQILTKYHNTDELHPRIESDIRLGLNKIYELIK